MTLEPNLSITDLHVHRGQAHVLRGVTFEIAQGSVTALLGRNGVGKTTTLKAVLGILNSSGSILLEGNSLDGLSIAQRVRRGIGYVPEDREVFPSLTVRENLELAAYSPDSKSRLDTVHDLFPELLARREQLAGSLSGGQQQMVAIARVLLNPQRVMLIDEPTKGLAPVVVDHVIEALQRVASETTILLVEQNLRVANHVARSAVVLDHGNVVHTGGMSELFADAELTHALLGVAKRRKEASE